MFGFDDSKEQLSPQQEMKVCLNDMITLIDSTSKYDKNFYNKLKAIVDKADKIFRSMAPTEQAKVNMYWQSITMTYPNLLTMMSVGAMAAASVNSMVQTLRGHALNAIAQLS